MRRVLLWSTDPVGRLMAGPGIRYHRLASELAGSFAVTLVAPGDGVAARTYEFLPVDDVGDPASLRADVVVAQSLPLELLRGFRREGTRLILDLYAPALVEAAAQLAEEPDRGEPGIGFDEVLATTRVALQLGDAFIVASERQRDHWLGALAALGRLTPEVYGADPSLRSLVAVVPFGLEPAWAASGASAVKGVIPGIGASDRLLLWGGGIWNWFDPLTVIRAVAGLAERRGDVRLLFLGHGHPSAAVGTMSMAGRAQALAQQLGQEGRSVFFNDRWVPYEERLGWFADADIAVSAHFDSLETRLAFRTRLLDHIACGTPLVVTRGDVFADLVDAKGLGRTVAPGDVEGWRDALGGLLDDDRAYAEARTAALAAREELAWSRAARHLTELIEHVATRPQHDARGLVVLTRAAVAQARSSFRRRGLLATAAAVARSISGGRRR